MQLVWVAILAAVYFIVARDIRTATVIGLLLPSHWLLDYVSHRPDMPLYPGGPKVGLGMWNSLRLSIAVGFGLFALGVVLSTSATRPIRRPSYVLWALIVFLAVAYPESVFGPPPLSVRVLALVPFQVG